MHALPLRHDRGRTLGRALCKVGLHRWKAITKEDRLSGTPQLVTLNYCDRPDCLEPVCIVDVEPLP